MCKGWKITFGLICSLGLTAYIFFYNCIAEFFFSQNANGELLKVTLSVFGGIGLIWGLWINNKRIQEQSRQNKIAEDRNEDQRAYEDRQRLNEADKRFGEAIGYLANKKESIIIGGIYSLYQLAKEDVRYRSIVAKLLCSYLKEKSKKIYDEIENKYNEDEDQIVKKNSFKNRGINGDIFYFEKPILIQVIIEILFNNDDFLFVNESLDLSNTVLKYIIFKNSIKKCNFDFALISNCTFNEEIEKCEFKHSTLFFCDFNKQTENCEFSFSKLLNCNFYSDMQFNRVLSPKKSLQNSFCLSEIEDCNFFDPILFKVDFGYSKIARSYFNNVILNNCLFETTTFSNVTFNNVKFENTKIADSKEIIYNER